MWQFFKFFLTVYFVFNFVKENEIKIKRVFSVIFPTANVFYSCVASYLRLNYSGNLKITKLILAKNNNYKNMNVYKLRIGR